MNNHRRTSEKEQQETVQISDIKKDPIVRKARVPFVKRQQLRSHASQFQKERDGNNGDRNRGQVVVLHRVVAAWKKNPDHEGEPEWTVAKGDPDARDYTVVGKYLYRDNNEEKITFNLSLFIPENMEVEEVPGHEGGNLPHFRIQFGDILVFIYSEEPPKPGDYISGLAEIEVSESKRPNMGPKTRLYPTINLFVGYGEDLPGFSVEINSAKKKTVPKGSLSTSPTYGRMFIHIDPIPGLP
ncbi:MAG: hypothetical protein KAS87_06170 [Candidatus Omnitrophica bacterium]|nr:hypothetical protein [Candidatus Omnitrophota bacterium]